MATPSPPPIAAEVVFFPVSGVGEVAATVTVSGNFPARNVNFVTGPQPDLDDTMSDIPERVRALEQHVLGMSTNIATITERLQHMPTKHELWKAVFLGALVPCVAALWWIIRQIVLFWMHAPVK
jgi:hypothetical protein